MGKHVLDECPCEALTPPLRDRSNGIESAIPVVEEAPRAGYRHLVVDQDPSVEVVVSRFKPPTSATPSGASRSVRG